MIFLSMSNNLLLTIVLSFVVFDHVQTKAVDDELTTKQLEGRWYDLGKISTCEENLVQQCITHEVSLPRDLDDIFFQSRVPIHNMPMCKYGIPIYTYSIFGKLVGSRINVTGDDLNPALSSTVKRYNNGTVLIFTDLESETCASKSYRMWSRVPEVSAETKAAFEKLDPNGIVKYHDWDHCQKLRNETNDESTLKQLDGLWYAKAHISIWNRDNYTCTTLNFTMDYGNQTFNITQTEIVHGRRSETIRRGGIFDSAIKMTIESDFNDNQKLMSTISAVSCNNGTDQIIRMSNIPNYLLMSRERKVSAEIKSAFRRLSENFVNSYYKFYPQRNCRKRNN